MINAQDRVFFYKNLVYSDVYNADQNIDGSFVMPVVGRKRRIAISRDPNKIQRLGVRPTVELRSLKINKKAIKDQYFIDGAAGYVPPTSGTNTATIYKHDKRTVSYINKPVNNLKFFTLWDFEAFNDASVPKDPTDPNWVDGTDPDATRWAHMKNPLIFEQHLKAKTIDYRYIKNLNTKMVNGEKQNEKVVYERECLIGTATNHNELKTLASNFLTQSQPSVDSQNTFGEVLADRLPGEVMVDEYLTSILADSNLATYNTTKRK